MATASGVRVQAARVTSRAASRCQVPAFSSPVLESVRAAARWACRTDRCSKMTRGSAQAAVRALCATAKAVSTPRRLARRFLSFEDLILRFATRPDLDIFSSSEAGRTIQPVKVQQRSSGGSWRTVQGLADFALVQSYLSTAVKWGISKLDALRDLFEGQAWLPPGIEPTG
jgi:hypothetical protein